MSRRRRILASTLVLLLAALAVLAHWLLYTPRGLEFVLARLEQLETTRIEVTGVHGSLAGPLSFDHVVVDHDAVRIEADGVRADPIVANLLRGRLALAGAHIDRVEVTLKERGPQPESPTHFLPAWLSIAAKGATLRQVGVRLKDGMRLHVAGIRADLTMTRWRIDVAPFVLEDPAGRLAGEVFLRATMPLGLRSRISGNWTLPDGHRYRLTASTSGRLDRLGLDVAMSEPARLSFSGNAVHLDAEPRLVGTLRATDFDGSPWLTAGQLPPVSGAVAVDASAGGIGIDGTVTSPGAGSRAIRIHGSGRYAGGTLAIVSLRAWVPASGASLTAAGSVAFEAHAPRVSLAATWTSLAWPLAGEAVIASASGSCRIDGALPYQFDIRSQVSGKNVPAAQFTARGQVDREQLVVDRVDGATLGGSLSASGRLSFGGDQAWEARVDGRRLDVSALRADLTGKIDVLGEAAGRGFSASAPWTARISKLAGTLDGRALTGSGEIAHRDGNYAFSGVRIANGASHVNVDGRYGVDMDLRWSADVRSLSLLHPSLEGELSGHGTLRGSRDRPEVSGDAALRRLRAPGLDVTSADLQLDVDLADRQDSRIEARAAGIRADDLVLDSLQLHASGRMANHRIGLLLSSQGSEGGKVPGFKARLSATGDADVARRSWSGTLDEASFDFADGKARLASPVALQIAREAAHVDPLCLASDDARLCVEGNWHATPSSWRVLFSAEDWPLRRLITTLLGRREFDGLLQASGWAQQQAGRDWIGGAAIVIDKPTVDIRRNKSRSDRVEIGGGRVDVFADETVIRATANIEMAANTRLHGQVSSPRQHGQPLLEQPLSGEIRAESSVLTALPLVVPEIDHSAGRMDAAIRVGGTLRDPRFDGDFHLREGRLDLYRLNLSLRDATLDGRFVGDSLAFEGQATTPKGPMKLAGHFAWPGGVMTGSMRLTGDNLLVADTPEYRIQASPDLTVSADAGGYVVTGQVVVPWARIAPKDLSGSVAVSSDERIVGEQAAGAEPVTTRKVRARIDMKLGDDVRVESYGLKARLGGEVTVTSEPGKEAHGNGAIRVLEGEYKAFGVYVKIEKGVLTYQDSPLTLPTLDLVATRDIKEENVTVSVNVRGRIDKPFVTLSSDPAMPSNEALSYLLTGRSINTLQSNEAASVNKAAESLAVSGGGLLLGGLGSRIGIDEVTVEGTRNNSTQVVLGKFLSPNLFVSYGVSVAEAINTIKVRYTLNKQWSLRAEAGLEQSADIEFRIER